MNAPPVTDGRAIYPYRSRERIRREMHALSCGFDLPDTAHMKAAIRRTGTQDETIDLSSAAAGKA